MRLLPFVVYTTIGAAIWNMFLAFLGLKLKQHWEIVQKYSHALDIVVLVLGALGAAGYFLWRRRRNRVNAA